jgi:hypothetical protein
VETAMFRKEKKKKPVLFSTLISFARVIFFLSNQDIPETLIQAER